MANDPGLSADTQTFMEAIAGDGGVHDTSAVFWLSPDIQLTGSVSGIGKADPGVNNTVSVSFHVSPNGTLPPGAESITIDLWVANPSLAMAPNNPASTKHVDSIGMPLASAGGAQTYQFNWIPPSGVPASDPQAPGHKCLIARCYADPLIPSGTSFFAPQDPHVAQHNICIVPCGAPGAVRKPAGCGLAVTTLNPDARRQRLKLRAVLDLEPSKPVRGIVLRYLEKTEGFKRLAAKAPRAFGFSFEGVTPKAAGGGKTGRAPAYEAVIAADPGEVIRFHFAADLRGGKLGEAHIFHLTQAAADGRVHGGLTVAVLAI